MIKSSNKQTINIPMVVVFRARSLILLVFISFTWLIDVIWIFKKKISGPTTTKDDNKKKQQHGERERQSDFGFDHLFD